LRSFVNLHWSIALACTPKAWLTRKLLGLLSELGGALRKRAIAPIAPPLATRLLLPNTQVFRKYIIFSLLTKWLRGPDSVAGHSFEASGRHELDRQQRPSQQAPLLEAAKSSVCFLQTISHCLHSLNRVFNVHLVGFLLRATMWKGALNRSVYVSPETQVCAPCKWAEINAAGRDLQVPWWGMHEWQNAEQGVWFTDRWCKCRFACALSFCGDKTWAFNQGPDMGKCRTGASEKVPPPQHHQLFLLFTKSATPEHCPPLSGPCFQHCNVVKF